MLKQNKWLFIGTGTLIASWIIAHVFFVQENWQHVDTGIVDARGRKESLDKFFKKDGRIPKSQAVKMLDDSNFELNNKLAELKRIEFGNHQTLAAYTEAAAKNGDVKTYLDTKRIQLNSKVRGTLAATAMDLGIGEKSDDSVSLNLMRLAFAESFLASCKDAGVSAVNKIMHAKPSAIALPNAGDDQPVDATAEKGSEKPAIDRLIQYPMKVMLTGPEKSVERLLLELQQPTDPNRGYFALRGFQVMVKDVKDTSSGTVEAAVSVVALLNETEARAMGIWMRAAPKDQNNDGGGAGRY